MTSYPNIQTFLISIQTVAQSTRLLRKLSRVRAHQSAWKTIN